MNEEVRTRWLAQRRLEALLSVLDNAPPFDALTLLLKPADAMDDIPSLPKPGESLEAHAPTPQQQTRWLEEMRECLPTRLWTSETGAVIFWSDQLRLAVEPPFPLSASALRAGIRTAALRALLHRQPVIGVVLLRLGRYSVGVFRGQRLLDAKTSTRYVKGRHSAGGTSQRRFARVRENQMHHLYVKVCEVARQKLQPHERDLERVFLGGERHTLSAFLKDCDYLQRLKTLIAGRILSVGEPKRRELERMPREIWKSRVTVLRLPEGFPFQGL